jgi:hypothetical protein
MIIDVNGKKIAFGLAWKRLVGGGTPEAKAVSKAREVKSALIWTDGGCFQRACVRRSEDSVTYPRSQEERSAGLEQSE